MKKIGIILLLMCVVLSGCSNSANSDYNIEQEKYIEGCINLYEYKDAELCRYTFETENTGAEKLTIKASFFSYGEEIEDYTFEENYELVDEKGKIWIELNDIEEALFKISYCAVDGTSMITKSSSPVEKYGEDKYKYCYY